MENPGADAERLSLVIERLVRSLRALLTDDPLSPAAAAVLSRLDRGGPSGITVLARAERVTQPAMTQLISRLHNERLVDRQPSVADRRSVVVALTDAGRAALAVRRELRSARVGDALRLLDATERGHLAAALPALEHLVAVTQLDNDSLAARGFTELSQ